MTILSWRGCHSQQPACGRAVKNSRIIEGQDATPGSWPWHAIVVTYGPYGYDQCGGSLITNQWVLTSAQCLPSSSYNTVVHLGRFNQSGSNPNEQTQKVENIVCYSQRPNYDYYYYYWPYNNDICLLKLSAPVIFTDYVQPICLSSTNSTFYNGTSSWVTGFGYDNYYQLPNILQEVNVPILGNNECSCYLGDYNYWIPTITENVTCTGPKLGWKGPCKGDEGEPLMMKAGSVWVQIGITSYSNCGGPSIYTRVSQYQKWISDTVTGTPPGFVTFSFPGADSDSNFTCPTSPPTTIPAPFNTTVSTPFNTTVSTPLNTAVSTRFNTTVSTPLNTAVSTRFNTTVSTPLNTAVSTRFNTTVSTPLNTAVSTPFNTTVIPTTRNKVENLTHFTHFTSLCVLVVLLHLFGGSGM
uniref:chymotrypsinogen A-like isoform X1 n=1 Tax=Maylandia zebra TaxID=106582 RepID=UPI0006CEDAC1|nr:chymotrypsinogen A-like isoform X1 [Maylandia zebra]